ncbi:hypothetical protein [Bacillus sp. 1P06AnD]|uniref:hypothetical protein n=1 Tax=Bacillus sp. 1P06AnD TaxID=3132208 RepID=UPI0039A2EC8A
MKPLTAKELEYIADSMSNEDLLIKQCLATLAHSPNQATIQLCGQMLKQHSQHYQGLMALLQQHTSVAPKTPQEATQMAQAEKAQAMQHQSQLFSMQQPPTSPGMQQQPLH